MTTIPIFFYVHGDKGLVVEGNSGLVDLIRKDRHRDICVHACISNANGEATLINNAIMGSLLGDEYDKKPDARREVVKTLTINTLIKDNPEFAIVDFCSIDIDSSEELALQSCDFNVFKPTVLLIENFLRGIDQTSTWEEYIDPFYTYIGNSGCNGIYLRKEWYYSYFVWERNIRPVV